MLYIVVSIIVLVIGGYFAFRYLTMIYAFKCIVKEINDIHQDLTQNQMLHLPVPNRHLRKLLASFNMTLEGIQKERQRYEKREKEFQKQIENISHDLRTPLTVILGYLKLIKQSEFMKIESNQELSETMAMIEQKAEMMKNLVTQFYDFSRLNAGDYELLLDNVDVVRILRESFMGNYQILEQAHLKIDIDIPDHPIWAIGEQSALERIFQNLFQNAGRYADTFLCISVKTHKEHISVSFINDTKVLFPEDIPHLFDRFYMHDNSRNQEGTGLGLTVAKALASEMGAELNVCIPKEKPKKTNTKSLIICFELQIQSTVT